MLKLSMLHLLMPTGVAAEEGGGDMQAMSWAEVHVMHSVQGCARGLQACSTCTAARLHWALKTYPWPCRSVSDRLEPL